MKPLRCVEFVVLSDGNWPEHAVTLGTFDILQHCVTLFFFIRNVDVFELVKLLSGNFVLTHFYKRSNKQVGEDTRGFPFFYPLATQVVVPANSGLSYTVVKSKA